MVKIGAKIIKNHKTIKTFTYINVNEYDRGDFYEYLVKFLSTRRKAGEKK